MIASHANINLAQPVNWLDDEARGLVAWFLCVPGLMGGRRFVNLCNPGPLGNHGTLTNMDPQSDWVGADGRPGGAGSLDFDGADDFVLSTLSYSEAANAPFTLSLWFKWRAGSASLQQVMVTHKRNGVSGWFVGRSTNVANNLLFLTGSGFLIASEEFVSSVWTHAAFVYDGVTKFIYQNGKQVASAAGSFGANNLPFGIGRIHIDENANYWTGALDDIAYRARALSAAQVRRMYQRSLLGYPGLLRRVSPVSPVGGVSAAGRLLVHPGMAGGFKEMVGGFRG